MTDLRAHPPNGQLAGITLGDIEPDLLADAMMRGAADHVPQAEAYWTACHDAAAAVLKRRQPA
jgi:hypothetical protein